MPFVFTLLFLMANSWAIEFPQLNFMFNITNNDTDPQSTRRCSEAHCIEYTDGSWAYTYDCTDICNQNIYFDLAGNVRGNVYTIWNFYQAFMRKTLCGKGCGLDAGFGYFRYGRGFYYPNIVPGYGAFTQEDMLQLASDGVLGVKIYIDNVWAPMANPENISLGLIFEAPVEENGDFYISRTFEDLIPLTPFIPYDNPVMEFSFRFQFFLYDDPNCPKILPPPYFYNWEGSSYNQTLLPCASYGYQTLFRTHHFDPLRESGGPISFPFGNSLEWRHGWQPNATPGILFNADFYDTTAICRDYNAEHSVAVYCLENASSSSSSDSGDTMCRATIEALTPVLSNMILECNRSGNASSYNMLKVPENPLESLWCVVGGCYSNPISSSSSNSSSSAKPSSSSNYSSSSQEIVAKHNVPGPNAVYTVNDCFNSGLDNMEPGKCYSLNPSRGTQYGWISNDARDRWWWVEVPCGGEDEDDEEVEWELMQCFGSGFLQKKSFDKESYNSIEPTSYDSYEVWGKNTKFYDALGRKTQARPETRRYLFLPKKHIVDSKIKGYSESGLLRVLPDGKECGVLKKHYGIVLDNGQRKGGITCRYFDVLSYYEEDSLIVIEDSDCICSKNSKIIRVKGTFSYTLDLTINEIYYVEKNFVFLDGYVTTEKDENAMREHELKHQQDNASIIKGGGTISIDTIICRNNLQSFRKKVQQELRSDIKDEFRAKAKAAEDDFHQKCYIEKLYEFCE